MCRKLATTLTVWFIGALVAAPALGARTPDQLGEQVTATSPGTLGSRKAQPARPSGRLSRSMALGGDLLTSTDNEGNVYYAGVGLDGTAASDIYCARHTANGYTKAKRLGPAINSAGREYAPFVAPDGSYLIFARHDRSLGVDSFFLSFRTQDGHWTEAIYLREYVPTMGHCLSASITPTAVSSSIPKRPKSAARPTWWTPASSKSCGSRSSGAADRSLRKWYSHSIHRRVSPAGAVPVTSTCNASRQ